MSVAAVLFAAGRGKRLRPLTDKVAKPVLPMLDVPLALFGLPQLLATAPTVVMNVRHLPRSVTAALAPYVPADGRFETFLEEPEAYGTGGTLVALRDRIGPRVVTWNADLLTDLDPAELLRSHARLGAPATVAVREVSSGADLVLDGDRAAGFVDRRSDDGGPGVIFAGAAVFERAVLDELPETRPLGLGETLLADLARTGRLAVHRHEGYWRDLGTPSAFLEASLDLLRGRGPAPPLGWPGEITGDAYLGPGASAGSLGPFAVVLAGARVEPGASVARSVVWPGETVPAGAEVRDAIWFGGRAIPAG